jgi:hypothetical protein
MARTSSSIRTGRREGQVTPPVEGYEQFDHEPEDYYTALPGPNGRPAGYFSYKMDFSRPTVPLHALDQHLNTVSPIAAAQAVLKSVVTSYHEILLGVRQRELAKAQAGPQIAPHREPGIHELSGQPHIEPGIHEKPAPAAKPVEKSMKDSKVFNLVKSQVMKAPKSNGGQVRLGKDEPSATHSPNVGQPGSAGGSSQGQPHTCNPNVGAAGGARGGAQVQPAAPSPAVGAGATGITAPRTHTFTGHTAQPAQGVGTQIVSPHSGQMPVKLPERGPTMGKGAPEPENYGKCEKCGQAMHKAGAPESMEKSVLPESMEKSVLPESMEKSVLPPEGVRKEEKSAGSKCRQCGKAMNPADALVGGADKGAPICQGCTKTNHSAAVGKAERPMSTPRANGGSIRRMGKAEVDILATLQKTEFIPRDTGSVVIPESKPYKKWSGTGGDIKRGQKLGKDEMAPTPAAKPPAPGGKPQTAAKPPVLKPAGIPAAPKPPGAPGMTKGAMSMGSGGRQGGATAAEGARNASFQSQPGTSTQEPTAPATPRPPSDFDAAAFRPASPGAAGVRPGMRSPAMLTGIRRGQPALKAERPMTAPKANGGQVRKA